MNPLRRLTNMRFTALVLVLLAASVLVYVDAITSEAWAGVVGAVSLAFIGGSVSESIFANKPGEGPTP